MNEMPWPAHGDKAFVEGTRKATTAYPHWFPEHSRESFIAEGFRAAAEKVVSALELNDENRYADEYLFPVGFLYRHYLELQMKQIVRQGLRLQIISDQQIAAALAGHDLQRLWVLARTVLTTFWSDSDPAPVEAVEQVILQFHEVDGSGQSFRYATDKKGQGLLSKAPEMIGLSELRSVMEGIGNFFEGCQAGLENALDNIPDAGECY